MDADVLRLRKLTERVLRDGGSVPLAVLLELAVPVRRLRELASRLGISPKGFRVERAPAHALAPLLAERKAADEIDQVVALLIRDPSPLPEADESDDATASAEDGDDKAVDRGADDAAALRFREQEVLELRGELERSRQSLLRAQERESTLRQAADRDQETIRRLRAETSQAAAEPEAADAQVDEDIERELQRRIHDLEHEVEARGLADEALRRQLAVERTRVRELEEEVAELSALLAKGRRRKAAPEPPPPAPHRVLLPYFLPSFYRSIDGKERRSVERAVHSILLFCTEGHGYPGLDVKQLGGQDLWSLRASLGLRVYFRHRDDGDVEFIELADREEQRTTLRRLKER